jgi:hypothetical protein
MISLPLLFSIVAIVSVLGVILYYNKRLLVLEAKNDVMSEIIEKLNKKDLYEDYRNAKGLLSIKVKEAKLNGKSRM